MGRFGRAGAALLRELQCRGMS
eukprot:SAG31_NODE_31172_length_371_cov_0.845588_2_plen_21_part_01